MDYPYAPPAPMKRGYPGDWQPGPPPPLRPPKDPRVQPTSPGDYYGQSNYNAWGGPTSYPPSDGNYGYQSQSEGYYGWGTEDYLVPHGNEYQQTQQPNYAPNNYGDGDIYQSSDDYQGGNDYQNKNPQETSEDFTDDYSAFYGQDQSQPQSGNCGGGRGFQRGRGNQWRGGDQRGRGCGGGGGFNRGNGNRGFGYQQNRGGPRGGSQQERGAYRGRARGQFRGRGGKFPQKGMPPNSFTDPRNPGQFGGGDDCSTAVVPPVHSLSKARAETRDMSIPEKLHRLCLFLRSEDSFKVNSIQTIMSAISTLRLRLAINYEAKELTKLKGKIMYTGVLKLDNVFLARGVFAGKKELKMIVFQKAIDEMKTKTVAEIYHLEDPGEEAIKEELEHQMKADDVKDEECKSSDVVKSVVGSNLPTVLEKLKQTLKEFKPSQHSPVTTLDQAFKHAKIVLKPDYTLDFTRIRNGFLYCRGAVMIGKHVIGRGCGTNKKKCKNDTYMKTLDRLLTIDVEELLKPIPELPVPQNEEIAKKEEKNLSQEERLEGMITSLGLMTYRENNITSVDMAALANSITPMLVLKLCSKKPGDVHSKILCELYMDKIFIASSEGPLRRDCIVKAYNAALDVMTSTSVDTLLTQHRRITDEETKDPELLDVVVKGSGRNVESNLSGLKRFGHKVVDLEQRKLEDLVIIEHHDWSKNRIKNSFCILQYSCNQNGMVLQWETDSVQLKFRCRVSIQKQPLGESFGQNKIHARNLAASDALFKLYETHDVLKICPRVDDEKKWITYESIQEEAAKLKEEAGEETEANGDEEEKTDEDGNRVPDEYIMKVLKGKVDAFIKENNTSAELIFGPGVKNAEGHELRAYSRSFNLKYDTIYSTGQQYLLIYWKLNWIELVKALKQRSSAYGKYGLVNKEEIPKHEEILEKIRENALGDAKPQPVYIFPSQQTEEKEVNIEEEKKDE